MTVKQYLHMTVRRKILLMMRGRLCSLKKAGNGIFIFITAKVKITAKIINAQDESYINDIKYVEDFFYYTNVFNSYRYYIDIRVKDLYQADFCKLLLKHWFEMFLEIEKKMILAYPVKIKGLGGFNILMKKYLVSKLGWEQLEFLLSKGVENNCIASKAKSVKLSQLREAVFEMKGFKYQNNIKELIHKMKVMYVEGLKQVYKM